MKPFLLIFLAFITGIFTSQGQDLVVTSSGDSIQCKITLKTMNFVRFRSSFDHEIRSVSMPLDEIVSYRYNYFPGSEIPKVSKVKNIRNNDYQHWRMGVMGGWSKHIAQTSPYLSSEQKLWVDELKGGRNLGADIIYYISQQHGVGVKYVNFSSSAEFRTQSYVSEGHLSINYFGASYGKRWLKVGKNNTLLFNFGPGYVDYRYGKDEPSIRGKNIGWMADLGYDIFLSDLASLGFQVSYLHARLKKMDSYNDGHYQTTYELRKGSYESLHRLDFSVGLKFNL